MDLRQIACSSTTVLLALFLSGCGKPAYPDEQEVRSRFEVEHLDAQCELTKIYPAQLQPDHQSLPFLYAHIRFDAQCKDLSGNPIALSRTQVWQLSRERPSLFQDAWSWRRAGEI